MTYMLQYFTARLAQKKEIALGTLWMQLKLVEPDDIDFTAGQYVVFNVSQGDGLSATRLYSICSPDYQKKDIELFIHTVPGGLGSGYLNRLREGEMVSFRGPAGRFVLREDDRDKIFLATGTGIGPIRSQLHSYFHRHAYTLIRGVLPTMRLLWGVKTAPEAYFAHEFEKLQKLHPNFSFTVCLSRETSLTGLDLGCFQKGRITDVFNNHPISSDYYICGAPAIVAAISAFLQGRGVDKEQIFFEKF